MTRVLLLVVVVALLTLACRAGGVVLVYVLLEGGRAEEHIAQSAAVRVSGRAQLLVGEDGCAARQRLCHVGRAVAGPR